MMNEDQDPQPPPQPPVEVPREALSASTLHAVVESYVLRDGTDYGAAEISLESKITQVLKQIEKGQTRIIFDPDSESVTLMTEKEWQKAIKG